MQQLFRLLITFDVFQQFEPPKAAIGLRNRGAAATTVLMPEASIDEDRFPYIMQNYVRRARQFLDMDSVLVSVGAKETSSDHLGSRVAASNATHYPATLCSRKNVGHELSLVTESTGTPGTWQSPSAE